MYLLEAMIEHNDRSKTPLSKEKLWQAINTTVAETEDKERDAKSNANNMTMDTLIQPPIRTNTPREKIDIANERRIYLDSPTETLKVFNRLTLQSKINDSTDDHSNKNVPKSDQKRDPLVDTHTSDGRK